MSWIHAALYRAIQKTRREPVMPVLRLLEQSQWWPADRVQDLQKTRLGAVLQSAARAPYYRSAWQAAGVEAGDFRELADLGRFPRLEKDHLREAPESIRIPDHRGPFNECVTTGSSGVPLRVHRSRIAGAYGRAAQIRGRRWFGLELGDRQVLFGGLALERAGRRRARLIDRLMNRVRLNPFDLSEDRLAEDMRLIRRLRPRYLYGYPSALAVLAAHVERHGGGRDVGLRAIQCSSEKLYPHRREIIQRAFDCPVIDEYGAAEVSIIAMECPEGGLHQAAENVLIEITDETGSSLPHGEAGEVVVTDLNDQAAPLLRYRIGDRGRLVPGRCGCGRTLPLMEVLEGSAFGLLQLPDGRTLSGVVFYFLAESIIMRPDAGLSEIVIVRRGRHFVARAVPRPGGDPSHRDELRRRLAEILGPGVEVEVEVVERIDRRGSDKYRVLIDETS